MILDFDRPLLPGGLNTGNWTVRHGGFRYTCTGAIAAAPGSHQVSAGFTAGAPDPGATSVDYAPPPPDLMATTTVPAAAFAAFPLTPLP